MKNIIVFFVDDILNIVYNFKVINMKLNNIINKGMIVDKNKFNEEFIKIIKKEKIKNKLFGDSVTIVKNSFYNERDLFYLENIFNELGFLKVEYLDITDLFSLEDATIIEINNSYMVVNLDNGLFIDLDYFKDIPRILEFFSLNDKIILFGTNKNIPKIKVNNKEVYYYDNFQNYIAESLLKVKKYGS